MAHCIEPFFCLLEIKRLMNFGPQVFFLLQILNILSESFQKMEGHLGQKSIKYVLKIYIIKKIHMALLVVHLSKSWFRVVYYAPAQQSEARLGGVHSYLKANSDLCAHTRSRKCHFLRQLLLI